MGLNAKHPLLGAPGATGSHKTKSCVIWLFLVHLREGVQVHRIKLIFISCDPVVPGAPTRGRSGPLDQVTIPFVDPVVPGTPTRRDPTHQIKLLI